jgi:hypothetical protein
MTEHIVMALRHDRARSGSSCSGTSRTSARWALLTRLLSYGRIPVEPALSDRL